jgi:hypothetical protein
MQQRRIASSEEAKRHSGNGGGVGGGWGTLKAVGMTRTIATRAVPIYLYHLGSILKLSMIEICLFNNDKDILAINSRYTYIDPTAIKI